MTIVGCRIDGRLITDKSQTYGLLNLMFQRIMVVDNDVVNTMLKKVFETATPLGVKT